jgi:hypothetical protein
MTTKETERTEGNPNELAPASQADVQSSPANPGPAPAPTQAAAAPEPAPAGDRASESALADKLRAEFGEIAAIAAQAARLGVTVDAADAMRKGISADALRRSVLDTLAARTEATSVIAAAPATATAGDSPIVRRAKERAAAARA